MKIKCVELGEADQVKNIVCMTIEQVYPRYYPKGAVQFFLTHHNRENILKDIESGYVYMIEYENQMVGTVIITEEEISRLFVLPTYQGLGIGGELLEFAEAKIFAKNDKIHLDASLPAKKIYIRRGYKEISSQNILTSNGDYLCYDVMVKRK